MPRITLKAINAELARRGYKVLLGKAEGDFYFWSGEAADWLERTVMVDKLGALMREQWVTEFERLKKLNQQIMRKPGGARAVVQSRKAEGDHDEDGIRQRSVGARVARED